MVDNRYMNQIIIRNKKIKNIYFRVKSDLNIYVTTPKRVTKKYIYELINNKKGLKDWIEKQIDKRIKELKNDEKELIDGEKIYYLGNYYILKVLKCKKENIIIIGNKMYMYVDIKNYYDNNIIKKYAVLDNWYEKEAYKLFSYLIKKYSSIMNLKVNSFSIKRLKSKWGSCHILKKHILLNLDLIKYPIPSIEYIIIHELTHLIYPNHSKEFYDTVNIYMPDWKKNKKILNTFFINI